MKNRSEKIEIPENIKKEIINMYEWDNGPYKISKILKEKYDFDISYQTIKNRLIEWKIEKGIKIIEESEIATHDLLKKAIKFIKKLGLLKEFEESIKNYEYYDKIKITLDIILKFIERESSNI